MPLLSKSNFAQLNPFYKLKYVANKDIDILLLSSKYIENHHHAKDIDPIILDKFFLLPQKQVSTDLEEG